MEPGVTLSVQVPLTDNSAPVSPKKFVPPSTRLPCSMVPAGIYDGPRREGQRFVGIEGRLTSQAEHGETAIQRGPIQNTNGLETRIAQL